MSGDDLSSHGAFIFKVSASLTLAEGLRQKTVICTVRLLAFETDVESQ